MGISYYPSPEIAVSRLATLVERAVREVGALRNGHRHLVIVAAMNAMYLTAENARTPALRLSTKSPAIAADNC